MSDLESIDRVFQARCRDFGPRTFVIDDSTHSYAAIERHAIVIAARIRRQLAISSHEPHARIGILLRTDATFVASLFGVLRAGCIAVPIDPRLRPPEIAFLARHAGISALIADSRVPEVDCPILDPHSYASAENSTATLDADAKTPLTTAVMLATSGSTSSPKIVTLSHANLLLNCRAWNDRYAIRAEDLIATPLAACHSFGLTACLLSALDAGASVLLCQNPLPARVAADIEKHRATLFVAASSFYPWLMRSTAVRREGLSSLRHAMSGACTLHPSTAKAFHDAFGVAILPTYGLTEASPVVTATAPDDVSSNSSSASVGKALGDVTLRVVDGELHVRGNTVMSGYWNNDEATRAAFDNTHTADSDDESHNDNRWLRTGDLASIADDGSVTILGRTKDLIIRGGEKIYPDEIEDVLTQHPRVTDAAVIGMPDDASGEVPVAFVILSNDGADLGADDEQTIESLHAFCRSRLADFKAPRRFRIVKELPRSPNGKILRRALRDVDPA